VSQQNDDRDNPASLRQRAERLIQADRARSPGSLPPEEAGRILHELQVHQIELEMQNEELRRAQTELAASRARYFDLYDLAPVGYLTLSDKGLILETNLTAASLLGVARGDLVKRRLTSFVFSEDADIYYLHRKHLLETGVMQLCEVRMVRLDGGQFWARVESVIAAIAGGASIFRVVISDITERKHAEARLAQAQRMESVGLLAGGVAHDFNNLLTVINGYSWLMLSRLGPDDPLRPDLEEIHKAGESAAELTQQLLAFGRKQVLRVRLLDLNRLVIETRPLLERLAGANVEVRTQLNAKSAIVRADPHQLEQVFINLVLNARDAMPDGGRLSIETSDLKQDSSYVQLHPDVSIGSHVLLAVSDNGVGMTEETRRRVFDPFFTTKELGKGTGLGLATAQGIVAQSGGRIEVSSEPGRGTTFRIYLPAVVEAAEAPARTWAAAGELTGTETVLVVDDQAEAREVVSRDLLAYGYRVVQAENGVAALMQYERERERIDLVLTDLVMPEVGGRELAEQLKERRPDLKVLFMSGYARATMSQRGFAVDDSEFIQKPFTPEQLAAKIRATLDRQQGAAGC
jgi:PAS domain S-box-containing protein